MEEQLTYTTVVFKTKNGVSTLEQPNELEIIYDEVKAEEQTAPVVTENVKKASLCTLLHLVAAGLGIICLVLASVIILLNCQFHTVMSEQIRKNSNLADQTEQLRTEKADLQRQTQELTREKDGLNWTLGVILQYDNFPVKAYCTQKECKPCLDDWELFQSNCYLFTESDYYSHWKTWYGSHDECVNLKADLVVIESQEEQEFINNHTQEYIDDKHGYWIGLNYKDLTETWTWVDGSNLTVGYWKEQQASDRLCALTSRYGDPQANWQKTSCYMKNRYICETRALIKQDEVSAALSKFNI
uniref:C-type lectin domain family 4 member A n=1 Tax=Semicossyphus pulcher TaxID=241346 RepID=UPI0037E8145B